MLALIAILGIIPISIIVGALQDDKRADKEDAAHDEWIHELRKAAR